MIPWLLATALAAPFDAPTPVWLKTAVAPVDPRTCAPVGEAPMLPAGLPGTAVQVATSCGGLLALTVRTPPTDSAEHRDVHLLVTASQLSTTPIRAPDPKPLEVAWLLGHKLVWGIDGERGIPLAGEGTRQFALGERLEVLWRGERYAYRSIDERGREVSQQPSSFAVVRTPSKERFLVRAAILASADPLEPHVRLLVDRFQAGHAAHPGALARVPDADALLADPAALAGRAWLMYLNPWALRDPVHDEVYMDPVAQISRVSCEKRRTGTHDPPCGAIYLDYAPFGAWWPDSRVPVVVRGAGVVEVAGERLPRLEVVVIDPYTERIKVSPAWDGR